MITMVSLLAFLNFSGFGAGKDGVDFDYPQKVSQAALSDLKKGMKSGDGQECVDAIIRYSIAQGKISKENMSQIISKIEEVLKKENRPEYRAFLNYFEAEVFMAYKRAYGRSGRLNPEGELPDDYTEWDNRQFDSKIKSLLTEALKDQDALTKEPITKYKKIVEIEDDAPLYIPNLFSFLAYRSIELLDKEDSFTNEIYARWKQSVKDDVPALLYVKLKNWDRGDSYIKLYNQYANNEHCGMLLEHMSGKAYYETFKGYVKRYPNSIYTNSIKNIIHDIETQSVKARTSEKLSSKDEIEVTVTAENVNTLKVTLYRVTDEIARNNDISRYKVSEMEVVDSREVKVEGTVPFEKETKVTFPAQRSGLYVALASFVNPEGKTEEMKELSERDMFWVKNIKLSYVCNDEHVGRLFAVDTKTGAPIKGAEISILDDKKYKKLGETDENGIFDLSKYSKNIVLRATYAAHLPGDIYGDRVYYNLNNFSKDFVYGASIFTDLAIYRPGETVNVSAICFGRGVDIRKVLAGEELKVRFADTNGKTIREDTLRTDEYGRINTSFEVPKDRMNGRFGITLYRDGKWFASKSVQVSEYKLPTFEIDMSENKHCFNIDEPVAISGKIETFSGMPVADTEVTLSLSRKYWSWRWFYDNSIGDAITDTVVRTDKEGRFSVYYPASTFRDEDGDRYYGSFLVKALCTNSAGESHEAETRFVLGHRRGVEITGNDLNFVNDKPIKLPVVLNTTNESETNVECFYILTRQNAVRDTVAQGTFFSGDPTVDLTKVPSGTYSLHVGIKDDDSADKDYATIELYRKDDKLPPVENNAMWLPTSGRWVDDNNVAHITIGTSTPEAHIYYIASGRTKIISEGWLHYKPGLHELKLQIPNEPDEYVTVEFGTVHDSQSKEASVTLLSQKNKQKVELKVTSFRDRLTPGDKETWTFQLVNKDGKPQQGALLLALTNKAVESIESNTWGFSVPYLGYRPFDSSFTTSWVSFVSNKSYWIAKHLDRFRFSEPELYMYDEEIFSRVYEYEDMVMLGAGISDHRRPMLAAKNRGDAMPMAEMAVDEVAETGGEAEAEVDRGALDQVQVREGDVKTALWQPMLTTDAQGNLKVEFEVPATNSTWIMQAIGYTSNVLSDVERRETMTQKPIMVKPSVPRFVRNGDKATLAAVVQNATDEPKKCDAIIELFDPRTGDVIAERTFNVALEGKATEAVNIQWDATDKLPFVGFRIKAATGNFGDGEQVMIPVLTNISPVIETQPFYIDAGTPQYRFNLPQFTDDARVTLEYCDNPVWYCVTALPTIFETDYALSTRLAHNLFAIAVAQGVAKMQPNIKDAVNYWLENKQDSTLTSMLERNSDLKIGTLLASPWVREAERQTLRMSKIGELFDEELMAAETSRIINALHDLQNSDGGWVWYKYPGCRSSLYATGTVLEMIGESKHLGYLSLDGDLSSMVKRGLDFFDREYLRIYKEQLKEDKNNHSGFESYVYVRTLFKEFAPSAENAKMIKNCLKAMTKDWKGTSLGSKAFYALSLNRNDYQKVARDIIQSIREFAITKPHTGTYWDNLNWGWNDKVAVTATILEAMAEVDPRTDEIDNVRKWILLNKQSNDWGGSSLAADAVYALLSTGSKWLERNGKPQIAIGGEALEVDKADEYLGYFRREIAPESGAEVVIDRNGESPAWGSVYSQFHAPMTEIKEVKIDDISISKEYYVYAADGTLHPTMEFNVGDKVQVRTVIKADKDLDFVTVVDERASCFEPVDQVSGYRYADRSYYYHETKDSATNLFFDSFAKGTKVISYDVYVTAQGEYNAGIATVQCQYAPQITAHSAGKMIVVK